MLRRFGLAFVCVLLAGAVVLAAEPLRLANGSYVPLSNGERIYVRMAGHGPNAVILLPGNNCSGAIFEHLLSYVRAIDPINDAYTFYAFDYRGSGGSSYRHKISSLEDFARDFDEIVQRDGRLSRGHITLVGYSMGFGVALEMVYLDPTKYDYLVSLAGIGTRGVRVFFNETTAGTDPATGKTYSPGDWADSLQAVAFQQRSWQGEARSFENVKLMWDMLVFNDILKYNPLTSTPQEPAFTANPFYLKALEDVLTVQYMPESLYACHMFNATSDPLKHINSDGTEVVIPGSGRITALAGKRVLLVKARSDYLNWRGDLVVMDGTFQNTKYDLKEVGAHVDAVLIEPDRGFDHGFPIDHPLQALKIITAFIAGKGKITDGDLDAILGEGNYTFYPHEETSWETGVYCGF